MLSLCLAGVLLAPWALAVLPPRVDLPAPVLAPGMPFPPRAVQVQRAGRGHPETGPQAQAPGVALVDGRRLTLGAGRQVRRRAMFQVRRDRRAASRGSVSGIPGDGFTTNPRRIP